ncbi:MAG TPA: hypothetical protein VIK74_09555 [Parasegetibacter sp.]|jgi:hypothetical protein
MNKLILGLSVLLVAGSASAQTRNSNQNPKFEQSRSKYMKSADSLTQLQGTTRHQTYKAIDYLQDKAEAKAKREEFRRELRLKKAGRYYRPGYHRTYGVYHRPAYIYRKSVFVAPVKYHRHPQYRKHVPYYKFRR